jgi:diketogulonate reductase-like aldo/keto reductase
MFQNMVPKVTLNNGITMPQLGLGVFRVQDGNEVEAAVRSALDDGYRLIDTAAMYNNEAGVGRAIRASGIPRQDLFITTKLWNDNQGGDKPRLALEQSLSRLEMNYVDLYLIHWPVPSKHLYVETWLSLEKLYHEGKIRAIGVSNFKPTHLEELKKQASVTPVINQIELHPYFQQLETRKYCKDHGIQVESWSPLGGQGGHESELGDEVIAKLAEKYHKTPAQIVLRWHIQSGLVVIPKSIHPDRIRQNIDIFDFELSTEDMAALVKLDRNQRYGSDPDNV